MDENIDVLHHLVMAAMLDGKKKVFWTSANFVQRHCPLTSYYFKPCFSPSNTTTYTTRNNFKMVRDFYLESFLSNTEKNPSHLEMSRTVVQEFLQGELE